MHSREEYMEHEHIWLQDLFFALKPFRRKALQCSVKEGWKIRMSHT